MTETHYQYRNGQPVTTGICMMPDMYEQTYTVKIRSMLPVSAEKLKALIGEKHESDVILMDSVCTVANTPPEKPKPRILQVDTYDPRTGHFTCDNPHQLNSGERVILIYTAKNGRCMSKEGHVQMNYTRCDDCDHLDSVWLLTGAV